MSESGSRVRRHFTAEVEFMWTEDWRKKNVIFYKQKWHWKQHIFPSTSQPSVYPRFLQFRADLKLCGCTSGKSKGVTARGVWCDHRNWVWNTAKAQIQSQWYLKKWPAGWADGEDEEGENNKIVQRKDHRVYSTEHLAHQKHLKTFHSSSFSKTWRKKRIFLVWVQKLDISTSTKKKTPSSLRMKVILHVRRQQQNNLS